mmetsp:Transcript_60439/g.91142  ORF Transcript_60439/g.91142 Transcript_60439/m.91142 type:complete len:215 (-) Transcript_60439:140-784(-)
MFFSQLSSHRSFFVFPFLLLSGQSFFFFGVHLICQQNCPCVIDIAIGKGQGPSSQKGVVSLLDQLLYSLRIFWDARNQIQFLLYHTARRLFIVNRLTARVGSRRSNRRHGQGYIDLHLLGDCSRHFIWIHIFWGRRQRCFLSRFWNFTDSIFAVEIVVVYLLDRVRFLLLSWRRNSQSFHGSVNLLIQAGFVPFGFSLSFIESRAFTTTDFPNN